MHCKVRTITPNGQSNRRYDKEGFTLLEVLIAVGVLTTLMVTAVFVLDPMEYLRQARDARRIADIANMNIVLAATSQTGVNLGTSTTISVSVPDNASATCASLGLPKLPTGYQYRCVTAANSRKADGTGWIPVDLRNTPGGSMLGEIPVDPQNDAAAGQYYYFIGNGSKRYVIAAGMMESEKYMAGGADDRVAKDGGVSSYAFELGPDSTTYKHPNVIANGSINELATCTPAWDAALNGSSCAAGGFSQGYNSGVASPAVGYHAHADLTCGVVGDGCLEYIDLNSAYGQLHRWLGITQSITNPGATLGWTNGTKVKMRLLAKTDTAGKKVEFGLRYWSSAGAAYTFGPAYVSKTISTVGEWEVIEQEFTVTSDWEMTTHSVALYVYGQYGPEGKLWVDNIEVTYR